LLLVPPSSTVANELTSISKARAGGLVCRKRATGQTGNPPLQSFERQVQPHTAMQSCCCC
jgi:hypothetical protein